MPRVNIAGTLITSGGGNMQLHLAVIVVALLLTVVITVLGLMSMAAGGRTDEEFSTPLMWARVGAQGLTILLLVIAVLTR
jgi:Hypoxia induced protein conserved region